MTATEGQRSDAAALHGRSAANGILDTRQEVVIGRTLASATDPDAPESYTLWLRPSTTWLTEVRGSITMARQVALTVASACALDVAEEDGLDGDSAAEPDEPGPDA